MTGEPDLGSSATLSVRVSLPRHLTSEVDLLPATEDDLPAFDSQQMYLRLAEVPEQAMLATEIYARSGIQPPRHPRAVFAVGMGGSAAAAEFAAAAFYSDLAVPYVVSRRSEVPAWVGTGTLVLVTSWSGNTRETVRAAKTSVTAGADVIVIASGGELVQMAAELELPLLQTPGGMMPRLALTLMFCLTARVLADASVVDGARVNDELEGLRPRLAAAVGACRLPTPVAENPAKQLALAIGQSSPVFFAAGRMQAVSLRWKEQINENAKRWATSETLPGAHHNALIAIGDAAGRSFPIVLLESEPEAPINDVVFKQSGPEIIRVTFDDVLSIPGLLSAALLGDYMSVYAAYLGKIDPTPVDVVDRIKADLAWQK
jgi:glucose/mannose-6-phosphate isomerase